MWDNGIYIAIAILNCYLHIHIFASMKRVCEKRKLTYEAAKSAVRTCKERKSGENRYYKCFDCGSYHLTSWQSFTGHELKGLKVKQPYKRNNTWKVNLK